MTERMQMESVVEAILFVSNDPVPRGKLLEVFDEKERPAASEALDAVLQRYSENESRGILVDEVAGGLRLVSRPDLHGYLRRFFEVTGSNKLSMPALESLAIIAYRQPVTGPEIQELRGVNSSGVLKKLLERRMIRIAGRKEVVGKPFLYATTREFLQHFGLQSLKELPPLEQFEELFGGDVEGAPASAEPDPEEQVDREVAEMEELESEAMDRAESDAIESERIAVEETESVEGAEASDEPETSDEPEASEEPETSDEPEASEEPETSDEPEASEEPETSDEPEAAEVPEATDEPDMSEVSGNAEGSEAVEEAEETEESEEPEATDEPEESVEVADPEHPADPEVAS